MPQYKIPASRDALPEVRAAVRVDVLRKERCPRGDTGRDAEVLELLSLNCWAHEEHLPELTLGPWWNLLVKTSMDRSLSGLEPDLMEWFRGADA